MVLNNPNCKIFKDTEDIWSPYKALYHDVCTALSQTSESSLSQLEELLRLHKYTFINLLRNAPKDANSREELRQFAIKSSAVFGRSNSTPITEQLFQETCIISDIFNCNEYTALDLLCIAEHQLPNHPGLSRGLVAVLLYYDGRSAICDTLCLLAQARQGFTWQLKAPPEFGTIIAAFMDQLISSNLISNILDLLGQIDTNSEFVKLQQNRGLGGPKHQHKVCSLINKIRQALADTVFCLAAQNGLPTDATKQLIKFIASSKVDLNGSGVLDSVTLALQMALLYAIDVSVFKRREETEEQLQKFPVVCEQRNFIAMMKQLVGEVKAPWCCKGLQALTSMCWGLSLCALKYAPETLRPTIKQNDDECLVDSAIEDQVFSFLHSSFLQHPAFAKEEYYIRRMHTVLTDFIVLMPQKLKDMKNAADEDAKMIQSYAKEGLNPPTNLSRTFEQFLLSLASVYQQDDIGLELSLEFWNPIEAERSKFGNTNIHAITRSPQAQNTLHKFIETTGDMLPPALFVPYLKLLAALAKGPRSSRYAFALLNGGKSTISWDHFFKSLHRYSSNLHQEVAPIPTDSLYRPRCTFRGINPMELPALHSMLQLIKIVADNDPVSRLVLAQNASWDSVRTILDLVKCPIPVPLKAELLLTLSSLARSPLVLLDIWHKLELSCILATVPSQSPYQPRGIQSELEEVEARSEEFPLSRAMVSLIISLMEAGELPFLLGLGRRTPGVTPYVDFVVDNILLKFRHRSYRRLEEKWEVAELCLRLLMCMMSVYEPHKEYVKNIKIESSQTGGPPVSVSPHPGQNILIMLNSDSGLLKTIFYILDEACSQLEKYQPFPGKARLEQAALHCLTLLHIGLLKGSKLLKLFSDANQVKELPCPVLNGLEQLVFGINPRSGCVDHTINLTKFIGFSEWLPQHSLFAVKVLASLVQIPRCHSQLLRIFSDVPPEVLSNILHAFVECLDDVSSEDVLNAEGEKVNIRNQVKEEILSFLLHCLTFPSPTLAHLLLGFNTKRPLQETQLQRAGVLKCRRSCLHSVIQLLDIGLPSNSTNRHDVAEAPYMQNPILMERCFALIHALCACSDTARPTLRYLRASSDFLARHLIFVKHAIVIKNASLLLCASWVMRCVAIDIKLLVSDRQRSSLMTMLKPLLSIPSSLETRLDLSGLQPRDPFLLSFTENRGTSYQCRELLATILQSIEFSELKVQSPVWHFLDARSLQNLILECEIKKGPLTGLIEVSRLNGCLRSLLADSLASSGTVQRKAIYEEIKDVLLYATQVNEGRSVSQANRKVAESWQQLAVVLFTSAPLDIMLPVDRHALLLLIIKIILSKTQEPALPICSKMSMLASTSLLLLLQALRHCHSIAHLKIKSGKISMTNRSQGVSTFESDPFALSIDLPTIKAVITGITKWLQKTSPIEQMIRANLYGSLLSFLYTSCFDASEDKNDATFGLGGSESLLFIKDRNQFTALTGTSTQKATSIQRQATALMQLTNQGEALLTGICVDSLGGHEVCRMLAHSTIGALQRLGPQAGWATFMGRHGYLQTIIQSIPKSDSELVATLKPSPISLKPTYVYESVMALLCRLALNRLQAETLLHYHLLDFLSDLKVLDCHPYPLSVYQSDHLQSDDLLPSVASRYQELLIPSLYVCDALLSSLGHYNESCLDEVTHFLVRHAEAISLILRDGFHQLTTNCLKELRLLLSLISRVMERTLIESQSHLESAAALVKLRTLSVALLPVFHLNVNVVKKLRDKNRITDVAVENDSCLLLFILSYCHLLSSARIIGFSCGKNAGLTRPVFRPTCEVAADRTVESRDTRTTILSVATTGSLTSPDLGVLISQLSEVSSLGKCIREDRDREIARLIIVDAQQPQQCKEREDTGIDISAVRSRLIERINRRQAEVHVLALLVEQMLHLLWAHLDLYLRRNLGDHQHSAANMYLEPEFCPSLEDLSNLKREVLSRINESTERGLKDVIQEEAKSNQMFVNMLIRRIKRLIQFVPV